MTALASYSTGTVAVAADGTTVTGTSTLWLSAGHAKPGDRFQLGHFIADIIDVPDDTHLTITPWPGTTVSGAAYAIWKVSTQRVAGADAADNVEKMVAALNTSGYFVFVSAIATVPDPSLGDDGQFAFQPATGRMWVKSAGVWSFLGIYKAFNLTGAYNNLTVYAYGDVQVTSGSSYIYINATPSAGHAAPNGTYWQLLASKGDPGADGANGAAGAAGAAGAGYGGTSTSSLSIAIGAKTFPTQTGLAYSVGARVRATATAGATGWMEGIVTGYSAGSLALSVDKISGSGTGTAWNLNVAGEPGSGGGGRELLTAARTYYVRSDGSNSNNGLSNTSGGAFLTLQKALDTIVSTLDLGGQTVTIQANNVAAFDGISIGSAWVGGGNITLDLGGGTINGTTKVVACSTVLPGIFTVQNGTLTTSAALGLIAHFGTGIIRFGDITLGGTPSSSVDMVAADAGAYLQFAGNITFNAFSGWREIFYARLRGTIDLYAGVFGKTMTFTANASWSDSFIYAGSAGVVQQVSGARTISTGGFTMTGKRYTVEAGALINTGGGGATYFPGSTAGSGAGTYL